MSMYIELSDLRTSDHTLLRQRVVGECAVLREWDRSALKRAVFFAVDVEEGRVWMGTDDTDLIQWLSIERHAHVGQRSGGWLLEFRGGVASDDQGEGDAALSARYGMPLRSTHRLVVRQVVRIAL